MADLLYGRHAVLESLAAQRRVPRRLFVASGAQEGGVLSSIIALCQKSSLPIDYVQRSALDKRLSHANHQGVALETSPYPYSSIDVCLQLAAQRHEMVFLLLLDHLQDPQNVGTLLRTADVVGVHGVVLPGRRSVEITPAVVNASSGATEHLQIVLAGNLAHTIAQLQQEGVWVVGVEDDTRAKEFDRTDLAMPLALVVGAEGPGLARLTRERCDFLVRLPMQGHLASLNAAVAGSIVLYYAWRQRAAASDSAT